MPVGEVMRLLVFFGFFGDFVAGMRNVLACAFDGIAGGQNGGSAAKYDKHDENHGQLAAHVKFL